ncbi:TetR/AcrR family transcriptional regulator [Paenibacillus illinoisensis]|uniref:TetR/AcrR family transcriptional regulator n=1 Tax=Paenibacillus illinoisensis TaxID=59845 RepID=UPI001C8D1BCC|nr:TetR/AcrR family transcriptional regulator [Paenibacillus illinoisensis]MBY0219826.1 TetR/AcrR family transcriptional regulator [Paenibacillus illinoisensis]
MSPRNIEKDLQQREKRINHILDSALEIIALKGIGSVSINHIAAASGMSIGNMYHYFKSKDEIISELLRRGQTRYGEHVSQLAEQPGDALSKLLLLSESWLALENNWAYTILIHTARLSESSSEEIRREVTERFTNNLGPVASIMEQGQQEGLIVGGVPVELAYYFVSLIQGLTLQKMPGAEVPIRAQAKSIVSLFAARHVD